VWYRIAGPLSALGDLGNLGDLGDLSESFWAEPRRSQPGPDTRSLRPCGFYLLAWAQLQAVPQRQPPWQLQRSPQVQRSV